MHPVFDQNYEVTKEVVFFGNAGMKGYENFVPSGFAGDCIMFNLKSSIEDVVGFLGSAETVISSSYHGIYWALLLGKKVVGIPTSSKFYGLKHAIPICSIEDWQRYSKLVVAYPEALSECRTANVEFSEKVVDFFSG